MSKDIVSDQVQCFIKHELENLKIKNYIINISPGTARGDNYLGIIAKVQVKGKDIENKDITLNLIVKSAPKNSGFREVTPIRELYDREIYIYTRVLPEIIKFQNKKCSNVRFESFAKYYSSIMDDSNEAILLEDMKELGYKLAAREKPLDLGHVALVMKEYGKLHALSYALRDQKPALFDELSKQTQEAFFANSKTESFFTTIELYCEKALKSLDPVEHKTAYEKFEKSRINIVERLKVVLKSDTAGQYGVINHGDCWVYNMLFKYENVLKSNVPNKLCLLDWQMSRLGSPALDLSYFLFTSTDRNLREKNYKNIIKVYYDSLSEMMRELGSDPEKLFPFEVLQEHLKVFSIFGLCMAAVMLYFATSESVDIPDVYKFEDKEDMIKKCQFESKNTELYNSRISGVILDFVKYGYEM